MNLRAVQEWTIGQGLLGPENVTAVALDGGVSCEVFSVSDGRRSLVVKHAGPTLRVAAVWIGDPRRVIHEGEVLEVLSKMTPEVVPSLLTIDRQAHMIAMSHAPAAWVPWKQELLDGRADPEVAATLGRTLGTWHRETPDVDRFSAVDDYELFESLRLEPYFEATRATHPQYAAPLDAVTSRLRDRRLCLVHGDFSPKNVLIGHDGTWVLDFEVGHVGDPQFDLGFLLTHLLLKAIHRPGSAHAYASCSSAFLRAYATAAPSAGEVDGIHLCQLVGALLMARVHGKSPVEYLDAAGRARTVVLAEMLFFDGVGQLTDAWTSLERG